MSVQKMVKKVKKQQNQPVEYRPEVKVVMDSLELIKDFGYRDIWENDADFTQSFRAGSHCPRYHDLLHFLERELEEYAKDEELGYFEILLKILRNSNHMSMTEGVTSNPFIFRLNHVNQIINRLLELYLDDLNSPDSKSLKCLTNLYCNDGPGSLTRCRNISSTPRKSTRVGVTSVNTDRSDRAERGAAGSSTTPTNRKSISVRTNPTKFKKSNEIFTIRPPTIHESVTNSTTNLFPNFMRRYRLRRGDAKASQKRTGNFSQASSIKRSRN